MGPYDETLGRYIDHDDVERAVSEGTLQPSSISPGHYYDGDGRTYDSEGNPLDYD